MWKWSKQNTIHRHQKFETDIEIQENDSDKYDRTDKPDTELWQVREKRNRKSKPKMLPMGSLKKDYDKNYFVFVDWRTRFFMISAPLAQYW